MNEWFRDDRTVRAQTLCLRAEQQQLAGNTSEAQDLYREAAKLFALVALEVPADHSHTRDDLGIAAITCFERSADVNGVLDFAEKLLERNETLSDTVRGIFLKLLQEHRPA